jgi:hypothetical protein
MKGKRVHRWLLLKQFDPRESNKTHFIYGPVTLSIIAFSITTPTLMTFSITTLSVITMSFY